MRTSPFFAKLATAALVASLVVPAMPVGAADDTTPPVVTNLAPTTIYRNEATVFSAHYTDNSAGVASCTLLINSFVQGEGAMTLSVPTGNAGDATQTYTYSGSSSSITARVRCTDQAVVPNDGTTGNVTVTVLDRETASMGALTPTTATAGSAVTLSAPITDSTGNWNSCSLFVDSANVGSATRSGGTVSRSHTFASAGDHTAYLTCSNSVNPLLPNTGTATTHITVSAAGGGDTTAPSVTAVGPTTATQNVAVTLTATATDNVAINKCTLTVDGVTSAASMNYSGTTASQSYTFTTVGSHSVSVACLDTSGNSSTGSATVTVSAAGVADTTAPSVTGVGPATATQNVAVTVSATATDNVAINKCTLTVDGVTSAASMNYSGTTASQSHTFTTIGSHSVSVACLDTSGNTSTGSATVTVSAAGTPPPPPAPTSTDTDSDGLLNTEEATLGTSPSNRDTDGDQLSDYEEVRVYHSDPLRRDTDGDGYNDGEEVRNGYNPNGPGTLSGTTPTAGTLIKMPCPVGAGVNHPCKAVYFYGRDGKRHPFPHEKTYFSWYPNFGSVQNVSEAAMGRLPLGTNVTYRPGVRLVKFQTLNTVYAVTRGGALRALASEAVAVAIYGTAWNRQVDDIGDAFFSNYTFGADITQANQYVPLAETASVLSIDDNF